MIFPASGRTEADASGESIVSAYGSLSGLVWPAGKLFAFADSTCTATDSGVEDSPDGGAEDSSSSSLLSKFSEWNL